MRHIRLATLLALTATLTLAWVAATPSTAIPVGLADTGGISMGEEQANDVVLYVMERTKHLGLPGGRYRHIAALGIVVRDDH